MSSTGKNLAGLQLSKEKDWFSTRVPQFERFVLPLYKKQKSLRCLEIGTLEGRMPLWLFSQESSVSVTSIDIRILPELANNHKIAQDAGLDWQIIVTGSLDLAYIFESLRFDPAKPFDFVYIDGCHRAREVLSDGVLGYSVLKSGGVLAFDDYLWHWHDSKSTLTPKIAIDSFIACYADYLTILQHGQWVVWLQKK